MGLRATQTIPANVEELVNPVCTAVCSVLLLWAYNPVVFVSENTKWYRALFPILVPVDDHPHS